MAGMVFYGVSVRMGGGCPDTYSEKLLSRRAMTVFRTVTHDKQNSVTWLPNRPGHYIFVLCMVSIVFLLLLLFFSPILIGRTFDVCHTSTHDVALVRI